MSNVKENLFLIQYQHIFKQNKIIQQNSVPEFAASLRASSLWEKRMEACDLALTTGSSTLKPSSCCVHFPLSRQTSRNSVELTSLRSWTCSACITLFASGKVTSGKRRSSLHPATMRTRSCPTSLANSLSAFQGFMTVPPLICDCLHQQYPNLLLEPGRTSPPQHTGPRATQEVPPLPEA